MQANRQKREKERDGKTGRKSETRGRFIVVDIDETVDSQTDLEKERDGKKGRKLDRAKRQHYGCRRGQTETKWKCTQTEN